MHKSGTLFVKGLIATVLIASPAIAKPIPPIVERMLKEGITIQPTAETRVNAALGNGGDGNHLIKLLKDQVYGIELANADFNGRLPDLFGTLGSAPAFSSTSRASVLPQEAA